MAEILESKSSSWSWLTNVASPSAFMRLSERLLPWLVSLTIILFGIGLVMAFRAPPDYQQGETVRIMYVHVPAAWLSMACYSLIGVSSAGYLIWRHPLADVSAKAAAPIGASFTLLALVTGSLWGKPMWGTYWVWDARLTSVLFLFLIYIGLIVLRKAMEGIAQGTAGRIVAIFSVMGLVILPIIKFSVNWWNTLHQPASIMRADGPAIDPSLLWPLLVMAIAFTVLFVVLHLKAMRAEVLRRRCEAMIAVHVRGAAHSQTSGTVASNV